MTITETDIALAQAYGQAEEIGVILRGTEDQQRRLELRHQVAELTGQYWKLQQDKRREATR
jgi:hypothetical protein